MIGTTIAESPDVKMRGRSPSTPAGARLRAPAPSSSRQARQNHTQCGGGPVESLSVATKGVSHVRRLPQDTDGPVRDLQSLTDTSLDSNHVAAAPRARAAQPK
jgi:hypothetical protein